MTSEQFQSYVRIALYSIFGFLANYSITLPDATMTLIATVVGFAATFAWTLWGNRLAAVLSDAKKRAGVEQVAVTVNADKINPAALATSTAPEVKVKAA